MQYRFVAWALLLLTVLSQPLAAKEEKKFELSSEHFLLFTDTTETKGHKLLADLEARVAAFSQAFGKVPPRQFPIEVFLFDTDEDFVQTLPRTQDPNAKIRNAYRLRGPDRLFIVAKDKSPEDIANDAGHALGHALFERYVVWRPFWLAEGVAEYVRSVGRGADSKTFSDEEGYSANDLVTIVPSGIYNDNDPGGAFRTLSYRLVRILLEDKPDALKQYFQALRSESGSMPKFALAMEPFEARLKSYADTPLKAPAAAAEIKSGPADPARFSVHLGDVLVAADRAADASRWYNAGTKDALVARAIANRFTRSSLEAIRSLDRASREVPGNGLVQYHFGAMESQDKKDIGLQAAALERGVQLLPLMGRMLAELARVYALNGEAEKSLPLIARALELEPEFADHFYEIRSGVHIALGQFEAAFRDIRIAEVLPHVDRAQVERFSVKVTAIRKKIESTRREIEEQRMQQLRREVGAEAARREPPPKLAPPPPPVPAGSISYQIEARSAIEVVETAYPDYPEALRKSGKAGRIALQVELGPDGHVKSATVANSQLAELNTATVEAVKKWSFKPGNRSFRLIVTYSLQ